MNIYNYYKHLFINLFRDKILFLKNYTMIIIIILRKILLN